MSPEAEQPVPYFSLPRMDTGNANLSLEDAYSMRGQTPDLSIAGASAAVQALREVVSDRTAPASARVPAALGILDQAHRIQELEEVEERLAHLEEALACRKPHRGRPWAA